MNNTNIKISLPDVWTVRHYAIYSDGRRKYETPLIEAKRTPVPVISRYYGAVALINAGIVHLDNVGTGNDALLKKWIDSADADSIPLTVIGTIVRHVALPLEDALEADFLA